LVVAPRASDQLGAIEITVPLFVVPVGVDVVKRHQAIGVRQQPSVDPVDRIANRHFPSLPFWRKR
jgi:hypothetical protein